MAYVIDPHLAFSDRIARLLNANKIPLRRCQLGQVWPCVARSVSAYSLWPEARTVYWCSMSHRDTASGPSTEVVFSAFYEHVNLQSERTLTTATHLFLSIPFQIQWRGLEFKCSSSDYKDIAHWISAVRTQPWLVESSAQGTLWTRRLREDNPARYP
jgi:hypothetical protein